ncbi:MAG: ATP synthase F1 subunit epsilon [Anaerolineae bacterium]|nr:ATP synthase F1 subunit epsilon [Anaerolineae bacterium]
MPLRVTIVTQDGPLFEEAAADSVVIPGTEGEMGILPHHAALLTTLGFGELRVRKGAAEESFAIYGGVAEVRPDRVLVLADTAQSSYELDMQKAREARDNAERLRREGVPAEQARAVMEEIRRATMEENVLRKIKQRPAAMRIKTIEDDKK